MSALERKKIICLKNMVGPFIVVYVCARPKRKYIEFKFLSFSFFFLGGVGDGAQVLLPILFYDKIILFPLFSVFRGEFFE